MEAAICALPAKRKNALPAYWYMAWKIAAGQQIRAPELSVRESGSTLPEDAAMHTLLENGVLRIRFCASGAKIRGNAAKEPLHLEVPAGTNLSILTMSAPVQAAALDPRILLIAAFFRRCSDRCAHR